MVVGIRSLGLVAAALTTASAIVLSPVAPPFHSVPAPREVALPVSLAGVADPVSLYGDVINQTVGNAGAVVTRLVRDPAPIVTNIARNQVAYVSGLGASVFEGFWTGLYISVSSIFYGGGGGSVPFLEVMAYFIGTYVSETAQQIRTSVNANVAGVAAQLPAAGSVIAGAITTPLLAGQDGARSIAEDIADSAKARDLASLTRAVVDAPGVLVNAVVNGRCGATSCAHPGLLTPETGSIAAVLNFRDSIASAIKPFTGKPFAASGSAAAKPDKPAGASRPSGKAPRKSTAAGHSKRIAH